MNEKIGSVKMGQIERTQLLYAAPKILGVKDTTVAEWDDEKIVVALQKHFLKAKIEVVTCDRCGGGSDKKLTACPYCGDVDKDDEDDEDEEPKEEVEMVEANIEHHTNGAAKKKTRIIKAPKVEVLAKDDFTESDLDAAIAEVHRLKAATAVSLWEMGSVILIKIFEPALWKLRKDDERRKAFKYKNFDMFVKAELDLSTNYVYRSMEIAKVFTKEIASQIGKSHLRLLVGAPKEDHEELIKKIKEDGIDARGLYEEVKKRRNARGNQRQNILGTKETPTMAGAKASAEKKLLKGSDVDETKSIAIILGKRKKAVVLAKDGDDSTAVIEGSNGVNIHLLITKNGAGEDVILYYPKRVE